MKKTLILCIFALTSSLYAQTASFWQVQKVKSWDKLNIREKANHTSNKIGSIAYNDTCIINHGCGKNIDFQAIKDMEEVEIQLFLSQSKENWCYIESNSIYGWVNSYYLKKSTAVCK